MKVVHSNLREVNEPEKKRVPLWKDKEAIAAQVRIISQKNNDRLDKLAAKNNNQ